MRISALLAAVALAAAALSSARAQQTGYRDFGGRVDSETVPLPHGESEMGMWQPPEEFAAEIRDDSSLPPSVSMTSLIGAERNEQPRRVVVIAPNNTLRLWRINISNGSASNWGSFPNSYLDARTLSFPTP